MHGVGLGIGIFFAVIFLYRWLVKRVAFFGCRFISELALDGVRNLRYSVFCFRA